jgi:aspartyl-tRNA(Asn)/glutamyl-tRNA(Gln) amidotransferase subunit A
VLPYVLDWVASAASLSAAELFRAHAQIAALRDATAAACEPFDFVLGPVSPVPAFDAELASPLHDPQQPFEHIAFTVPWNMAENPAISINGGYDAKGFPIGVQIVGRRFDDIGVLGMAKTFEGLRGPQRPWPSPPKK